MMFVLMNEPGCRVVLKGTDVRHPPLVIFAL